MIKATTNPNAFGIQCLSQSQLEHIMGPVPYQLELLDPFEIAMLAVPDTVVDVANKTKPVDFWAPDLLGGNIEDHFELMAQELLDEFQPGIDEIENFFVPDVPPPALILSSVRAGWTRFEPDGEDGFNISFPPHPLENAVAIDTETFVQGSKFSMPIMGSATSNKAHYIWLSPQLATFEGFNWTLPFGECFTLNAFLACSSELAFWAGFYDSCTFDGDNAPLVPVGTNKVIAAHNIAFDGPRFEERYKLGVSPVNAYFDTFSVTSAVAGFNSRHQWVASAKDKRRLPYYAEFGCAKSLVAAYEYHADKPSGADKSTRSIFVDAAGLNEMRAELSDLLVYALHDTVLTWELAGILWQKHKACCPSKVTLAAHFLLADSVLPVRSDFHEWTARCTKMKEETESKVLDVLKEAADIAYNYFLDNGIDACLEHPWYKQLNWTPKRGKIEPRWLEELPYITTKKQLAHILLCISYDDKPIYKHKTMGYVFDDETGRPTRPFDSNDNIGNLLVISFKRHFVGDDPILKTTSLPGAAVDICLFAEQISFWIGNESRVSSRLPVQVEVPQPDGSFELHHALAPHVAPYNTISNRTGENVFLVTAAHTTPKIGSEVNSRVAAWPGWDVVSFDYDSQELKCLASYSDAYTKVSGSNEFSSSVLIGDKSNKTDTFSLLSAKINVCRDAAKQSTYSMCYGGGVKSVSETIVGWEPEFDLATAKSFAKKTIAAFKGREDEITKRFTGGQASLAFNKMLDLLCAPEPQLPLSGTRMQKSMWPEICGQASAPFQLNWFVQGSGAAQLHTTVLANWWLSKRLSMPAYLGVTKHDEMVYTCPSAFSDKLAYAFNLSHMWGWSMLHKKLGIYDMPVGKAFMSGVSIDNIWRKEPDVDVATPSDPFEPPKGRSTEIRQLIASGVADEVKHIWEDLNL